MTSWHTPNEKSPDGCKLENGSYLLKEIGRMIAAWRVYNGLTQEELAEEAHTSKDTIRRFECGEGVRIDTLQDIARALGVRLKQLIPDRE